MKIQGIIHCSKIFIEYSFCVGKKDWQILAFISNCLINSTLRKKQNVVKVFKSQCFTRLRLAIADQNALQEEGWPVLIRMFCKRKVGQCWSECIAIRRLASADQNALQAKYWPVMIRMLCKKKVGQCWSECFARRRLASADQNAEWWGNTRILV